MARPSYIAVLEFVASLVSSCTFLGLLPLPKPGVIDHQVMVRADATSTITVQAHDKAKSALMQELHLDALGEPTYYAWMPALLFAHLYGIGNDLADAASRDNRQRLLQLAGQLQVSAVRLEPHPIMHTLLATVERVLSQLEQSLDMANANTPPLARLSGSQSQLQRLGALASVASLRERERRRSN
jgi:hypothetical protein